MGKWYVEAYQHSTIGEGEDAFEFDKVAIYGNLNADGSGSWYAFFFNEYGNLIDTGNLFFGSGCHYTTSADGGVHIVLDGESSASLLMPSWDMTFSGGRLISADANDRIELSRITAEQDALVQMWLRILGLGYGGEENIVDLSQAVPTVRASAAAATAAARPSPSTAAPCGPMAERTSPASVWAMTAATTATA